MLFFRVQRYLSLLAALLFVAGHAHQVLGRFECHHHEVMADGAERGGANESSATEDGQDGPVDKNAWHMLEHQAVTCALPETMAIFIVPLQSVALLDVRVETAPEARVFGIDHPPQLAA